MTSGSGAPTVWNDKKNVQDIRLQFSAHLSPSTTFRVLHVVDTTDNARRGRRLQEYVYAFPISKAAI